LTTPTTCVVDYKTGEKETFYFYQVFKYAFVAKENGNVSLLFTHTGNILNFHITQIFSYENDPTMLERKTFICDTWCSIGKVLFLSDPDQTRDEIKETEVIFYYPLSNIKQLQLDRNIQIIVDQVHKSSESAEIFKKSHKKWENSGFDYTELGILIKDMNTANTYYLKKPKEYYRYSDMLNYEQSWV